MEVTASERHASGGPVRELPARNLYAAFQQTVERLGSEVAIRDQARDVTQTWDQLDDRVDRIAGGLAASGLDRGDTVALMLNNRPEFFAIDMAAVALGGVPFSIYQTSSPDQIEYVCSDAGAKVAFVEEMFLDQVMAARQDLPSLERVIVVDGGGGDQSLAEFEETDTNFDAREPAESVEPDDLLTLIYTSGTTGPPKGVQLTHRNLLSLVGSIDGIIDLPDDGGRVISWLPAAHIAERGAHYYLPMVKGLQISICPDPRKIGEFLPEVRPTWFFSVPRIYEKMKAAIESKLAALPDGEREPAQKGLAAAVEKVRLEQEGEDVPEEIAEAVARADEQLFSKLRRELGLDEVVAINVGAAPTPLEVLEFFHAIGIPVGELWGMSETCGVATCNPPEKIKLGTVGPPVPGVEIRLAEDGEVQVRADAVMPGYRNMPDKNEETFEDGWLLTGDIGELDEDGYLKIVDRKKELIINAAGKNMSPANIESSLKAASPLIGQAIAIGDKRPYNVALIVLDADYAPTWAAKNGLGDASPDALAGEDTVREAIEAAVEEANANLSRVEQIKKFTVLPTEWEPGGDELTPTMKLKRRPIADKYSDEIEALYA